jgi:transcriptional regulator with XRE-family HTH domain
MNSQKYQPPKPVSPGHRAFLERIGSKLKTLREERNLTISFLETELGISRNSYSLMERGLIYFTTSTLFKILDYYKLSPEDFFREL